MRTRSWFIVVKLITILLMLPACNQSAAEPNTMTAAPENASLPLQTSIQAASPETDHGPAITVEPRSAMGDETVQIQVVDLEPGQVMTLTAELLDAGGRKWTSWATFAANEAGIVDLTFQAPLTGTYQMVDAMGLFWSMLPHVDNMDIPYFIPGDPGYKEVTLRGDVAGEQLAPVYLERRRLSPTVEEMIVSENGLVGRFYIPETTEPVPALLVLGGSGGNIDTHTAAILSAHGYATLALDYFGGPGLPADLTEIPLEYFKTALVWLQAQAIVADDKIGVLGTSRGGEAALLIGATYPEIRVVVSYVGSGLVQGNISLGSVGQTAAWTLAGEPVPFRGSDYSIAEATIPVENINGPVLLISGRDDQVWSSTFLSDIALSRLRNYNHPFEFSHLAYEDAGHAIFVPYWPTTGGLFRQHDGDERLSTGGTPSGNAYANADSWPQVLAFLERAFK